MTHRILQGKGAIITGSSRGIGTAIAFLFASEGASVIVNYRSNEAAAKKVVRAIQRENGIAVAVKADVRKPDQVQSLIKVALREFGAIDILVNNAHTPFRSKAFLNLNWKDVQTQIEGTLHSAFTCCKAVLPHMIQRKAGKIINIGSISVDAPDLAFGFGFSARNMAKAALIGLTRSLAYETGALGITVNMIVPGWTATEQAEVFPKQVRQKAANRSPMARMATVQDIASAVLFYASEHANFITGDCLPVCGGTIMR